VPLVVGHPQSPQAAVFLKMARTLRTAVITPAQ
jgi:hypothetical protein